MLELSSTKLISQQEMTRICLEAGADDVGFVSIDNHAVAEQTADIRAALPSTRTLISLVVRMNREAIRSTKRSVANLEFHSTGDETNLIARRIVRELEDRGVKALNPSMGFPMEMTQFPGKIWVVSHKPIAEAAGMGKIGIHRNVIHPKFGSFILLATILTEWEMESATPLLDFNPCVSCKLCVAACPVGAIEPDGYFNFSACYTHNYREFMGGFTDWAETVAASKSAPDYRDRVTDSESASMWQSLSFGANYKAAYCLSVCPAGEMVKSPFDENRAPFLKDIVKPLQEKEETLYVVAGSDAETHAAKRFPHKQQKRVNGIRPNSVDSFLQGMPLTFQRKPARGWSARYHFLFSGDSEKEATVLIDDGTLEILQGLHGRPDLVVRADAETWVRFLRKQASMPVAILRRKIRIKGDPRLLLKFGACFPS